MKEFLIKIINLLQQILQDVLEEIFHEHVDLIFFQIIMYIQHYQLVEYHDVFDAIHHKFLIRFFVFLFSKIFNRFLLNTLIILFEVQYLVIEHHQVMNIHTNNLIDHH